ncbi:hypothetical protein FHX81_1180 [Saccharothrix saharensis]|uniref:Uncharacterized protein n=1 Tax=Saccharothrix saharensis TaxID=571190 RepID=A0A543J7U1_9PSEU|nr:hypothetical protein [Saccharothrix saharensis]TQM78894.1 hypothetical protein FHX81_1180 [Saccharothrix saharensis]
MNCQQCRTEFAASATGRPRLYCSSACRQRAFRARRDVERTAVALPGQVEALAVALRDNAEVIRFLARGWTPVEPDVSLPDLLRTTAELAERLRDLGGRLVDHLPADVPWVNR